VNRHEYNTSYFRIAPIGSSNKHLVFARKTQNR